MCSRARRASRGGRCWALFGAACQVGGRVRLARLQNGALTRTLRADAEKARKAYNAAKDEKDKVARELSDLEKRLASNYGEDDALMELLDKCFSLEHKQYTYEVCPYNKASQKERGSATSLGNFVRYESDKDELVFEGGQSCWNGPQRSARIKLVCGKENKVVSVDEPSRCVYAMTMHTPAVCNEHHGQVLLLNLEAQFSDDGGDDDAGGAGGDAASPF
jgi:protein kinase C substrate 80K-H